MGSECVKYGGWGEGIMGVNKLFWRINKLCYILEMKCWGGGWNMGKGV